MVLVESVGSVRTQRPNTAPFNVCIYKVTDRAGDCWSIFEGCPNAALYQIQIAHDARPSLLMNFRDSFSDFLKQKSTDSNSYPANLESLREECGIKLILTDRADPDNVGFVQSAA